jgi:hypothetical protein
VPYFKLVEADALVEGEVCLEEKAADYIVHALGGDFQGPEKAVAPEITLHSLAVERWLHEAQKRPVTIGNLKGISLQALAEQVIRAAGNGGHVRHAERPRAVVLSKPAWVWVPRIGVAERVMAWRPHVPLEEGILRTLKSLEKGGNSASKKLDKGS